ncbi:alpha/beta fold hydrolase [Microvirga sp. ACRRW]|uniref:carboxylesterase family protein n=1 Tax=Microvirga sp. ACRRW TaxID=2918205 RepID=UPI001EF44026|nr:dienelactone hydrolase family protein [Microvirga sp. ACRRW]MCG7392649.1 alpha/beta fold hydrolase [Microvirga sp. ACRRW]
MAPDGIALPYRILKPDTGPMPEKFPLVLVLHGTGAMGTNNATHMGPFIKSWALPSIRSKFKAYVVAPQVAIRSADYETGVDGYPISRPGGSMPAIRALVEKLAGDLPIDRSRIYVIGFSMGASTALNLIAQDVGSFAGALAFSGVAPDLSLARMIRTPIMFVHGTDDRQNDIAPIRKFARAVAEGGGHATLLEYQGLDHRVPPGMLPSTEWRDWLFGQRRH